MAHLSGLSTAVGPNPNPNYSVEVVFEMTQLAGSVSSLSFSPKGNFLVATSWDHQVRCWKILETGNSVPKAMISHDQPVLCSTWKDDGTTVFSGGFDEQVQMWPLMHGVTPITVAIHDGPVKQVAWVPEMNLLVTGSWDKTLRYWDIRQSNPVHIQQLPDRCYALTVQHPLMVVGTADRNLIVFNLQNPQTEFKRITSPFKYQTRCVAAFPDHQGFLVGSMEGKVGVLHVDDSQQSKNFTFKCHRHGNEIYTINSLNFHPVHHTFATAGSDGAFNFWDKDSKKRLKAAGKPAPLRISPLLSSRQLSSLRRIRRPIQKYCMENDGVKVPFEELPSISKSSPIVIPRENPRSSIIRSIVPFYNDELSRTPKADALFIPRENPRALSGPQELIGKNNLC